MKNDAAGLKLRTGAAFAAYSFTLAPGSSRLGFLAALVAANLAAEIRCALATPLAPEQFLARCDPRRGRLLQEALARRDLLFFQMIGDYAKNVFRFGPQSFLRELEDFGLPDETLLVVDHAELLFSLHHDELALEQLKAYQDWLTLTRSTALLIFSPGVDTGPHAGACQAVIDNTCGSARLACERGMHELWVDFWQAAHDKSAGRRIVLEVGERQKVLQDVASPDDADERRSRPTGGR